VPIYAKDPPKQAVAVVDTAINERVARSAFVTTNLRCVKANAFARSVPHRVLHLPLSKIRRGNDLRQVAEEAGWRFLIHGEGKEAVAAVRVLRSEPDKYVLGDLSEGAFVSGTERAIRDAEGLPDVKKGRYEAVLLVSPGVYSAALWLQDLKNAADLIIAIPTFLVPDQARVPLRPMTPAQFLEKLEVLAQAVRTR
jgi:hypothetical protein